MKILFYDYMQESDAPSTLISPALSDTYSGTSFTVTLSQSRTFDSVGIGYTDADNITINGETISLPDPSPYPDSYRNGLYLITAQTTDTLVISHDGSYIGRLAVGMARELGAAPSREPGFYSTNSDRETLSMQTIPGAGGVTGRKIQVDFRYKFTETIVNDIELAYPGQIGRGYPLFLYFDTSCLVWPWARLYGKPTDKEWVFESSARKYLYSYKINFKEAF